MKKSISFSRFNAELNTDACDRYNNAELTLTLRIGFRQVNPGGGATGGTYPDYGDATETRRKIIKWTSSSWQLWKSNFVRSAQRYWHGKFWLINDSGSFAFTAGSKTYIPNVWCRFKLVGNEATAAGNHHTIDVVRLHSSENWFGSHSTLYDSRDTLRNRKGKTSKGKKVFQRAHVHEMGHLLGLNHVDVGKPHCLPAADTNASACYGIADVDKVSVMGSGMTLRIENVFPWRQALRTFASQQAIASINPFSTPPTSKFSFPLIALTSDWPAALKRHYPRTESEMRAGKALTSRPHRGRR
jgi:hypothetical protein